MYDISKYVKEYEDRKSKCEYCASHSTQLNRLCICKNPDWFTEVFTLKEYIKIWVSEDSEKEFRESDEATKLKAAIDLRENVYNDFNEYVKDQKEILDFELELKHEEWSELASDYELKMKRYVQNNINKALESFESTNDSIQR